MHTTKKLACTLPALLVATTLAQQITPVNDYRYMTFEAQANTDFGADQSQDEYHASDLLEIPFDPWSYTYGLSANYQSASANTNGTMDTVITATSIRGSASVYGFSQILDETGYDAGGGTAAVMQVGFTLDQASTWEIIATLMADSGGVAQVTLSQGLNPGGNILFTSTNSVINEQINLESGDYTLTVTASVYAQLFGEGMRELEASFDAQFNLVPAPASSSLVILGLALTARRRRS
ncbi:MAG: hypothetical protein KDA29_14145 [Phycisphaerales bacterium]|nr:hypothetical protein [Phycisphaerales bacterium]